KSTYIPLVQKPPPPPNSQHPPPPRPPRPPRVQPVRVAAHVPDSQHGAPGGRMARDPTPAPRARGLRPPLESGATRESRDRHHPGAPPTFDARGGNAARSAERRRTRYCPE